MKLTINNRPYEVELQPDGVVVGGTTFKTSVVHDNGDVTVRVAGRPYKVKIKDEKTVVVDGRSYQVEMSGRATVAQKAVKKTAKTQAACPDTGAVRAPMPGKVVAVRVKEGEHVAAGAVLLVMEAMKMQNDIKALVEGTVTRITVTPGQNVNNGDVMVVIE